MSFIYPFYYEWVVIGMLSGLNAHYSLRDLAEVFAELRAEVLP